MRRESSAAAIILGGALFVFLVTGWSPVSWFPHAFAQTEIGDCVGDSTTYLGGKCEVETFCRPKGCTMANITCPDGEAYTYAKWDPISSIGDCRPYNGENCEQCESVVCASGNAWTFFDGQCDEERCPALAGHPDACVP